MNPLKTYLVEEGMNLKGKPSYWLDLDDDEDEESLSEYQKLRIENTGHLAGFFNSKDEAKEYAIRNGWEITNL
jgi:hypothetical protein